MENECFDYHYQCYVWVEDDVKQAKMIVISYEKPEMTIISTRLDIGAGVAAKEKLFLKSIFFPILWKKR